MSFHIININRVKNGGPSWYIDRQSYICTIILLLELGKYYESTVPCTGCGAGFAFLRSGVTAHYDTIDDTDTIVQLIVFRVLVVVLLLLVILAMLILDYSNRAQPTVLIVVNKKKRHDPNLYSLD